MISKSSAGRESTSAQPVCTTNQCTGTRGVDRQRGRQESGRCPIRKTSKSWGGRPCRPRPNPSGIGHTIARFQAASSSHLDSLMQSKQRRAENGSKKRQMRFSWNISFMASEDKEQCCCCAAHTVISRQRTRTHLCNHVQRRNYLCLLCLDSGPADTSSNCTNLRR